jgi:epoxyqueuosine reductase
MDAGPKDRIVRRAEELGFDRACVARADEPLGLEFERYQRFVDQGMHGAMAYLARHREARRRLDGDEILPGARSVVCLAKRYARADDEADPPLARRIARYARGQDYHNFLRKKLRLLAKFVRALAPGVRARPLLDEEPVLERAWAARSGLGFVGKNGLVIVPGQGSYLLLGEVVTTLPLPPDEPIAERCGSCTRCLDACPTQAFAAPFVLDPRRCVAYMTIEDPAGPRDGIGEHLFGCDDCQAVCPFNRTAPPPPSATRPFRPLDRWSKATLTDLLRATDDDFARLSTGSPLQRATRVGLARSAAIVARNTRTPGGASEDAASALAAAAEHDDASVRALCRSA